MKKFRFLLLLILFTANVASAKTLLILGDSLSAAYNMQTEQGWVALLKQELTQKIPELTVINASISGETTSGGITRLPALIDRHQPDYIVLELAANDGLRGTPIHIINQNLETLIKLSKEATAEVLLIGVRLPPNYGPRYITKFFDIFAQLSEKNNTYLVPFLMDKVALNPELMQGDGLHPNAQAQPEILDNVRPYLYQMLEENN